MLDFMNLKANEFICIIAELKLNFSGGNMKQDINMITKYVREIDNGDGNID